MVTVFLTGGLGNQMFQYAAGRALAHRLHRPLILDVSWFRRRLSSNTNTKRHYELSAFPELRLQKLKYGPAIPTLAGVLLSKLQREWIVRDTEITVAEFNSLNAKSIRLMGYWQDEKYFRDIKELIRKEFGITHSLISDDPTSIRIDSSEICLGVHVRRGDYLQPGQQSSNLSALSIDYYKSAIDLVRSHCSVSKVVIVSDDPQWCRSKFRGKEFSFSSNVSTVHDFKLLNSCDHVVISNSTFSWWAAWLKTGNSHKVVAPRCWYSNGREFASFPEDWNLI